MNMGFQQTISQDFTIQHHKNNSKALCIALTAIQQAMKQAWWKFLWTINALNLQKFITGIMAEVAKSMILL